MRKKFQIPQTAKSIWKNYVNLFNNPNNLTDLTPQKQALKWDFVAILLLNQL